MWTLGKALNEVKDVYTPPKGIVLLRRLFVCLHFFICFFFCCTVTYILVIRSLFYFLAKLVVVVNVVVVVFLKQRDLFYLQLNERNMLKIIKYMSIYVKIQW